MSTRFDEYDIVFAGGGTTACVVAGRLAQTDPSLKILIIEAGPHTLEIPHHIQPARFAYNLSQRKTFFDHKGPVSQALGGRSADVLSACCLGGGSSVNFAIYTRASASDYDDWEQLGNSGWGSKDLIPLARKVETYQAQGGVEGTHGDTGPIKVSLGGYQTNTGQDFLRTAALYDRNRSSTTDANDFSTVDSYAPWPKYINKQKGRRSDTAHHFIYNQDHNQSLRVLTNHRVLRIIFEDKRAVGVEYVPDDERFSGSTKRVYASRLVVLSSGAFGSPAILERSGIGSETHLVQNGVVPLVELPGVGENYMDHNLSWSSFVASENSDSLDEIFSGDEVAIESHLQQWTKNGTGLMAHNSIDAAVRLRPTADDLQEIGPSFEKIWSEFFTNSPDKPVAMLGPAAATFGPALGAQTSKTFSIGFFTTYPKAVGYTHITSSTDPWAPYNFDPQYLEDYADVAVLRWCYKHGRELARRMPCYRGEVPAGHPKFDKASAAAVVPSASGPCDVSTPKIAYASEDDSAIDEYIRASASTAWHSLGTCAMKPQQEGGVVDSRLNVYGVENLRVADLSIAPLNVSANTYNTALVIGEKAFSIIAQDLGMTS